MADIDQQESAVRDYCRRWPAGDTGARTTVVVFGGTGRLGAAISSALRHAHNVVSVALPGPHLAPDGVRGIPADLRRDEPAVAAALDGADGAVYAVAPRPRPHDSGSLIADTARRAAAYAVRAGVRRWVHLSNISVYPSGDGWIDDHSPVDPGCPLGHATLGMELAVRTELGAAVHVTFLRLGPVYQADVGLTGASTSYVAPGTNWMSFVCRDDLVAAVRFALAGYLPDVCVVSDGVPVRAVDAATIVARHRGVRAHPVSDSLARRLGPDGYHVLTSSMRLRPRALIQARWRPSVRSLAAAASQLAPPQLAASRPATAEPAS